MTYALVIIASFYGQSIVIHSVEFLGRERCEKAKAEIVAELPKIASRYSAVCVWRAGNP